MKKQKQKRYKNGLSGLQLVEMRKIIADRIAEKEAIFQLLGEELDELHRKIDIISDMIETIDCLEIDLGL